MSTENNVEELPEDIEVIGPGQMLAEARVAMGLSQQQVADKLNFRTTLVKEIEQEIFDKSLPATFNRGYLKNYAKLVNISVDEVLSSYEMLNVAEKQGAEMQSFSKQTEKQAENNRLMWLSYFILAALIGSTIVWWLQDAKQNQAISKVPVTSNTQALETPSVSEDNARLTDQTSAGTSIDEATTVALSQTLKPLPSTQEAVDENQATIDDNLEPSVTTPSEEELGNDELAQATEEAGVQRDTETDFGPLESAQFTFSGDCWVNIYDATGERIAWGIKKSGYVMNITGQAPFNITLGKPELVSIVFEQQDVDMSKFNQGNIAKFTLPLN